ncbi:putative phage tail protein [Brevibacillus sp. NRS-1366]|uniref:putative phage tail protein n=1 Tax=Brevibacillus sp. NRS-1366 TaxID=3233899 RepID=UPI003D24EC2E
MSQRLINLMPPYYKNSKIAKGIFGAIESESDGLVAFGLDVIQQGNPRLATWGIQQWETDMKLAAVPEATPIEQRRARVLSRMGTPPVVTPKEMERLLAEFTRSQKAKIVEYGREKRFSIEVGLNDLTDLAGMSSVAQEMKPKHLSFAPSLGSEAAISFDEQVFMTSRRYHKVSEFRVGMKPMKYQSEVKL